MATMKQESTSVTKPSSPKMQTPKPPTIICTPPPIDTIVRTNTAKLELGRENDSMDRDLGVAVMTLTNCRQECLSLVRRLEEQAAARLSDQTELNKKFSDMNSKCHEMGMQYNTLYDAYRSVYGNYHGLQERCAALSADLEEQKSLVRALEIQIQRANEEAATAQDWKAQELQVREKTIKELKEKIDYNETTLRKFKECMDDFTNKLDKIETERDELEAERDTLAIKNEKATSLIDHLKKDRLEMAELHTHAVEGLESEIQELKVTLDKVETELFSRYPNMHDNLDNIKEVLEDDGETRKSKKRKGRA
ncbi:unnamed protein product [Clonostachys rosea f. rosea IK726]|uniref:Uncharacterized protein n=1 Tax=Clonostachys rosea f. rosea IK726 TaxID=1349383 RepID=A0ACA9U9W5_BIOOC|nr:unnamed protein product [Clonostachys rosea f. rosea IK726]